MKRLTILIEPRSNSLFRPFGTATGVGFLFPLLLGLGLLITGLPAYSQITFETVTVLPLAATGTPEIGDFNGDSIPDIAAGYDADISKFAVFLGTGNGNFAPATIYNPGLACGSFYTSFEMADFNNDDYLDIIKTYGGTRGGCFGNKVTVHLGDGNGDFTIPGIQFSSGGSDHHIKAGELNGDNYLDLVISSSDAQGFYIHFGVGDGTFSSGSLISSGYVSSFLVEDLNSDGNNDIAIALRTEDAVKLYLGNGSGSFSFFKSFTVAGARAITNGDFNEDNIIDLAVSSNTNGTIDILLGTGEGSFSGPISYYVNGPPAVLYNQGLHYGLEAIDLDIDGHQDLVVGHDTSGAGYISILRGNGNGSFCDPITFSSPGSNTKTLAVADLNSDGKPDIAAAVGNDTIGVVIFINSTITTPASPSGLSAIAGDGQVQLQWSANTESDLHKYNIYRGTSSPANTLIDSVVAQSPPDTLYIDTTATNGQIYYYRITAVDSAGNESDFSDEVFAIPTLPPEVEILHAGLTEENINGANIDLTLSNETFADGSLISTNFTSNNAPTGVTVSSITYINSTTATLTLAFDGTDFDSDINDFSITVAEAELTGTEDITSNELTITATDDPEVISLSDDGITEGSENGEIITVTLTGGTFVNPLTTGNWNLANLPNGVTKGSVVRINATQATITLSGNRTTDYDSNITNITVSITDDEINDHTGADIFINTGVTFTAVVESATISHAGLTEANLNGALIEIKLINETFDDGTLDKTNFNLNNAPPGTSVDAVNYVNTDTATVTLAFDGTDFDIDYTDFSVTINELELTGVGLVTSNTLTITAVIEPATATIIHAGLTEENLNTADIDFTLSYETFFNGTLDAVNFTPSNAPTGTSVSGVTWNSTTNATVTLAYDGTDFDIDINDFSITVAEAELTGTEDITSNELTITATDDPEVISLSDDGITEGSENGEIITVTLTGGTFVNPLTTGNWNLANLPNGVTKGSVVRINATQATITLSGNRITDYDSNITNITVSITDDEINDHTGADIFINTGVTFTAVVESATISHAGLTEANLNGALIEIKLINETFDDGTLDKTNFSLNNAPPGTSVDAVNYVNTDTATVTIAFDGTDFDIDYTDFSVTINELELTGVGSVTSNTLTITALIEPATATITHAGLTEENLNTADIDFTLSNETFADGTLHPANFLLSNAPNGTSVNGVTWNSSTNATVTLAYDGTDFDDDISNFYIVVAGAEVTGGSSVASSTLTITATNDDESITITDDGSIIEGAEDGEIISVKLTGGTFVDPVNENNWTLTNLPDGVSKGTVTRVDADSATIALSGNRTTDYDTDITDLTLAIKTTEINDTTGADITTGTGVTFSANDESVVISHTGLDESNLDGAVVSIKLTNETFADNSLDLANFTLNNVPPGTTKSGVSYEGADTATITLAFDGTDFDVDINNFSITISAIEITGSANLSSNEISIIATIESSENDILTYSFTEQTGAATIDAVNHTVDIEVAYSTDVSALVATFTISDLANITVSTSSQVSGVTSNDFSSPVTYTVTAEDGTTQDWVVTVTIATSLSSENDILTYSFTEQTGAATIDAINHTVDIEVAYGTDVSALVATFTISDLANITVSTSSQVSGVTSNDFSSPVTYTVTAEDGTTQDWMVTVTIATSLSSENDILTYSFTEQTSAATIDAVNHTVDIEVAFGTDVTVLVATFTISDLANITVDTTSQVSGVTSNDFSSPVTYTVTAENGATQNWVVTVSEADILVISDFPYSEDFESGNGGWRAGGVNSSWQLGNPAGPTISSVTSGSAAWVTNLAGDYNPDEISYIISPRFNLSGINYPKIEFNIWWHSEGFYDGANLQYKQGTGEWKTLGTDQGDDSWYNSSYIYSIEKGFGFDMSNSAGWSGDGEWGYGSDGWVTVSHALTGIDDLSDVRFRIAFASNSSYQNDGIAIDDINIFDDPTGIDPVETGLSDIQIYPNPNEGKFRLVYNGEKDVDLKLQLINLQGQVILSEQIEAGYRFSKEFELDYLPPGIYYFRLMHKDGVIVKKMMVK